MLFALLSEFKTFLVTVSRIYLIIFVYAKIAITSVLGNNNNNNFSSSRNCYCLSFHFDVI